MLTSLAQNLSQKINNYNPAIFGITALLMYLIAFAVILFVISALIMVTYNNSITKMNTNWQEIDYKTAIVLTLLLMFIPRTM